MSLARPDSAHRAHQSETRSSERAELRAALNPVFGLAPRAPRIVDVETRPSPYASSFAIEEATVRFDDGSSLDLVCKDTGEAAMLPEARRIRPRFLYDPFRETRRKPSSRLHNNVLLV